MITNEILRNKVNDLDNAIEDLVAYVINDLDLDVDNNTLKYFENVIEGFTRLTEGIKSKRIVNQFRKIGEEHKNDIG